MKRLVSSLLALSVALPPLPVFARDSQNVSAPRQAGMTHGRGDGANEGNSRGSADGREAGKQLGYRAGYDQCEREERQRAFEEGFREGIVRGREVGGAEGHQHGTDSGLADGRREGEADGIQRSENDAHAAATPPGRARGIEEANQSDASARGQREGLVAGDQQARAEAQRVDYPRGRQDYYRERYAEAIESEDQFSQRPSEVGMDFFEKEERLVRKETPRGWMDHLGSLFTLPNSAVAGPDSGYPPPQRTHWNPRGSYSDPRDQADYQAGYSDGYNDGYYGAYRYQFERQKERKFEEYFRKGCVDARFPQSKYDGIRRNGFDDGYRKGHQEAYAQARAQAYQEAYRSVFGSTSNEAYNRNYPGAYDRHFESARSQAYQQRYSALYDAAFESARLAKYEEMYPQYAREEYARGRADETEDFRVKPVRLLFSEATETILNGVYEPGEPLRVRMKLRNFADSELSGRDVKVVLQALDQNSAVITEAQNFLAQNLKRKSVTEVSEAFDFRMNENAVERAKTFRVTVYFQERNAGTADFSLTPKFWVKVRMPETPVLQEGIPAKVRATVQNQGTVPTDASLTVEFQADTQKVAIRKGRVDVGVLNPGETRSVEFEVIARTLEHNMHLNMAVEARLGHQGRRIGLLDETRQVPVRNDYRIAVTEGIGALSQEGVARISYVIQNVNARTTHHSLQVKINFTGDDATAFQVIGPNPQYLRPLLNGREREFVVPIQVSKTGAKAVFELEVKENGRHVVSHIVEIGGRGALGNF